MLEEQEKNKVLKMLEDAVGEHKAIVKPVKVNQICDRDFRYDIHMPNGEVYKLWFWHQDDYWERLEEAKEVYGGYEYGIGPKGKYSLFHNNKELVRGLPALCRLLDIIRLVAL